MGAAKCAWTEETSFFLHVMSLYFNSFDSLFWLIARHICTFVLTLLLVTEIVMDKKDRTDSPIWNDSIDQLKATTGKLTHECMNITQPLLG